MEGCLNDLFDESAHLVLGSVPDAEVGHVDEGPVVGTENGPHVEPERTIPAEHQPVAAAITASRCLCQW